MAIEFDFKSGRTDNTEQSETAGGKDTGRTQYPNTDTEPASDRTGARNNSREKEKPSANVVGQTVTEVTIPKIESPKVRKPRQSKKGTDLKDLEQNINVLTCAAYSMTAKLLNSPLFEIKPDEAATVAAPLARIIDRMELTDTMNKYGDGMALVTALAVITAPRVIIYMQTKNAPKMTIKKTDKKESEKNVGESKGNNTGINKPIITDNSPNVPSDTFAALDLGTY